MFLRSFVPALDVLSPIRQLASMMNEQGCDCPLYPTPGVFPGSQRGAVSRFPRGNKAVIVKHSLP